MRTILRALLVAAFVLSAGSAAVAQSDKPVAAAKAVVNLNTATLAQLEDLPGIGRATAERILEYRQKSGGFKKIEEILENSRSAPVLLTKTTFAPPSLVCQSRLKSQEISR